MSRLKVLSLGSTFAASTMLVACGGGGGGTAAPVQSQPTQTTVVNTVDVCTSISGCVATANGFQFPDGAGGTMVCVSGSCSDNNSSSAAYNNGYSAGQASVPSSSGNTTTAYNNGYDDGKSAGYNSGYSDGQASVPSSSSSYNSGYADGSSDGQASGYSSGYADGNSAGYNSGYADGYSDGYSDGTVGYSVIGSTKDTDLQKAKVQAMSVAERAGAISQQFGMSYDSAKKLTDLSDQVRQMAQSGQLTAADRVAVAHSALKIAGLTTGEVDSAIGQAMKGNLNPVNDVMEKAAKNLGMASSADLRDKLLPSVGLSMP